MHTWCCESCWAPCGEGISTRLGGGREAVRCRIMTCLAKLTADGAAIEPFPAAAPGQVAGSSLS